MITISSPDAFGAEKLYQLSDLRKRRVYHNDEKIGWLADLVIEDRDIVAEVTHVRVGRPFGNPPYYIPWEKVSRSPPKEWSSTPRWTSNRSAPPLRAPCC